jgi:uroporphyrinogen decarboxylase
MIDFGHRERVFRSLEYESIDRIPWSFRAEPAIIERMKKAYHCDDAGLTELLDTDFTSAAIIFEEGEPEAPAKSGDYLDLFGNRHQIVYNDGYFTDNIIGPALAHAESVEDILKYQWPHRSIDKAAALQNAQAARGSGRAVVGGAWASIFTIPRRLLGEEHFLVSLFENPEMIDCLVGKATDYYMAINRDYYSLVADNMDIYYFGSDFGTQRSMFIGPDMYRRFFKPHMKRLVDQAKGFGQKVMFHTCGAVSDIIPDLIDIGVDILDPVQVTAAQMSPAELQAKYKGLIAFHGGISSQTVLPFGTPGEVEKSVRETIDLLGPLGYFASSDQEMIGDVPLANIEAMIQAIRAYRCRASA